MVEKAKGGAATLTLRERNRLRTRREFLDAALTVFTEMGYGSASIENIAARAGASKVTLYSYFPQGCEGLFRELYQEINAEVIDRVAEIFADEGDFAEHVIAATTALMGIAQRPRIGRFYSIDDPALDGALAPVRGHASQIIADLITQDIIASRNAGRLNTTAAPGAVAELLVGAMGAALKEVADAKTSGTDVFDAMKALVTGL